MCARPQGAFNGIQSAGSALGALVGGAALQARGGVALWLGLAGVDAVALLALMVATSSPAARAGASASQSDGGASYKRLSEMEDGGDDAAVFHNQPPAAVS